MNSLTHTEKIVLTRNLALFLRNGVTVNEALTLQKVGASKRLSRIITSLVDAVESGEPLSQALSRHEKAFGKLFVSIVRAGEMSGSLDASFEFLTNWMSREYALRGEIRRATLYPKIVLALTVTMGVGMASFVLPRLIPLFESLHTELPMSTIIVLAVAEYLESYLFHTLGALAALVIGMIFIKRWHPVRMMLDRLYLKIPFIGTLIQDYQLALFAHTFESLFKSGVSVNESLGIVSGVLTNERYRLAVEDVRNSVETGISFSSALSEYPSLFPTNVIHVIRAGERTGGMGEVMESLASFYTEQIMRKTKKLPTIIEPLLLVGLGVTVGFIAISIISPIYEMTGNLR